MLLLHQQFVKNAKRLSKKLAIIDKTTGSKVPYSKALIGALILVSKFRQYDKGFIGIMVPTSAGCTLASVATLMSGRIPVMINYSTGAENNVEYARKKCKFKTVITSRSLLEKINCPAMEDMVMLEDIMDSVSTGDKLKAAIKSKLPASMILNNIHKGKEDDTAVILFTSGSEKDPKAVQLTHKNIISDIVNFSEHISIYETDVLLASLVFFHVFGLTVNLWVAMYMGMTMVTYANPLDFQTISNIARDEKPTIMVGTPSFFWGYLQKSEPGDFKTLRVMVAGADKCPDALREGWKKKHGVTLLEGYGATETSPVISTNTHEYNRPGSIGKIIPNVQVRIEHFETGKECAPGEVGKILIKGDIVMKGYFNDPGLTEQAFINGWYNTGDMGFMDTDGYLWHAGRFKRFVKIGGEMVSLVKVENTLEKHLSEGVACCVVDVADEVRGASIIATVTQEIDKNEIIKKLSEELSNIELPKKFHVIEELPVMNTGKIDFRSVTRIVQEMVADSSEEIVSEY
ncbi:MAG TPA: bifunctional acyl-ACP--phospholipid O-acyltransferase/long-chain-fatty-acid--ACP ligase [Bacteroidales bacterium]|nr:bifunctional acyl-ACP--phospholipid O-acyltransferase/long-chain-fatty-acid--ACP ligase [Bacteroidales bacterium]